jgi:acyl carrier protein
MAVEAELKNVIVQTLSVKPEEIKLEQSLSDSLGMDSTELVDLRVALEKNFGIKIEAQEITKDSTVSQIASLIERKKSG